MQLCQWPLMLDNMLFTCQRLEIKDFKSHSVLLITLFIVSSVKQQHFVPNYMKTRLHILQSMYHVSM